MAEEIGPVDEELEVEGERVGDVVTLVGEEVGDEPLCEVVRVGKVVEEGENEVGEERERETERAWVCVWVREAK